MSGTKSVERTETERLLTAGAVLPLDGDVGDVAESAARLTTRSYRHPALDDRVVVRLVAGELGPAEDLAAGFLGLEPDTEPVEVGWGLRQYLGFPEWVLVHHPQDGHVALGVVPELERVVRQAKTKPKAALDAYVRLADDLAASVPHFLPTFYEQAGRVFLSVENPTYAAQMFGRARRAESEHGLPVDEDRLDAVFLEFALAGALPVTALTAYAKALADRVPAEEAFRRFRTLCVRRTAGGLRPSVRMGTDLRRLARASGADLAGAEADYLAEVLPLSATLRAATGWWKAHRAGLVALARQDSTVRGTLLDLMPVGDDADLPEVWLEILEETGATAGLCEGDVPTEQRPSDGAVGWTRRFLALRRSGWRWKTRLPLLYGLVERMAGRLAAELTASGEAMEPPAQDVDLLDLLLSLGVPIADPDQFCALRLEDWVAAEGEENRRDLTTLEADGRFQSAFDSGVERSYRKDWLTGLLQSPGARPMLVEWTRHTVRNVALRELPTFPRALRALRAIPGEVLALAGEELRTVTRANVVPRLVHTLRTGLLDELGWPAWEEAVEELVPTWDLDEIVVASAWPHLVVAGPTQARVLDAEGTVLVHDLRVTDRASHTGIGFHYVDGELLVYWHRESAPGLTGYWHTAADQRLTIESPQGVHGDRVGNGGWITLPRPGGGRLTGGGVLYPGDTVLPESGSVASDGVSFWARRPDEEGEHHWYEYDAVSGAYGRQSMPPFFADATRDLPAGSTFRSGVLLPAPSAEVTPAATPVNGLLGWRVVRLPDGSRRCEDLAGHVVTVERGGGWPARSLLFPGSDRPRGVVSANRQVKVVDESGTVTSVADAYDSPGIFAAGTRVLPPENYWHCLRPRDPRGSLALREIDEETATALLNAAVAQRTRENERREGQAEPDALPEAIGRLLPEVSHDALVAGIAGVLRFAADQRITLDTMGRRLDHPVSAQPAREETAGPTDARIKDALDGLVGRGRFGHGTGRGFVSQLSAMRRAMEESAEPVPGIRLHSQGPELPTTVLPWRTLLDASTAAVFRAVVATTDPEHRQTLAELLDRLDALGLTSATAPERWRLLHVRLDRGQLAGQSGTDRGITRLGLLPLPGGAFLAVTELVTHRGDVAEYQALCYDPAGRFEVPAPYTVLSSSVVGGDRTAVAVAAFRTELAERGPAPWCAAAADEFADLTGVTPTTARLVVAGLPLLHSSERNFLPGATRDMVGVKVADADTARTVLHRLDSDVWPELLVALLPDEPSELWTRGPDVAAAAELWNARVGRRAAVPEEVLREATRAVSSSWEVHDALPALIDPGREPALNRDLSWKVRGDRARPEEDTAGFTATTLTGAVALAAWLAHRLPAGDPLRAGLPATLSAVRRRLAHPGLMLDLGRYVDLPEFRKVAGAPTEIGEGYERYGAVIMATGDNMPSPAIRTASLDAAGDDPYLPALRAENQLPFPVEVALRVAHDPRFAALLADPGEPRAGERDPDGTWCPQDPSRSVPELVAEVAGECAISADAAVLYLMLLAMPDPTDANTARWTNWRGRRGTARLKAARAELAGTDLVVRASRRGSRRSLYLPGPWTELDSPSQALEEWKLPLYDLVSDGWPALGVVVPGEPAPDLYRRAWQRIRDDDRPRFRELTVRSGRRR